MGCSLSEVEVNQGLGIIQGALSTFASRSKVDSSLEQQAEICLGLLASHVQRQQFQFPQSSPHNVPVSRGGATSSMLQGSVGAAAASSTPLSGSPTNTVAQQRPGPPSSPSYYAGSSPNHGTFPSPAAAAPPSSPFNIPTLTLDANKLSQLHQQHENQAAAAQHAAARSVYNAPPSAGASPSGGQGGSPSPFGTGASPTFGDAGTFGLVPVAGGIGGGGFGFS